MPFTASSAPFAPSHITLTASHQFSGASSPNHGWLWKNLVQESRPSWPTTCISFGWRKKCWNNLLSTWHSFYQKEVFEAKRLSLWSPHRCMLKIGMFLLQACKKVEDTKETKTSEQFFPILNKPPWRSLQERLINGPYIKAIFGGALFLRFFMPFRNQKGHRKKVTFKEF